MLDLLRREGVDGAIISAIEKFRSEHPVPAGAGNRLADSPRFE